MPDKTPNEEQEQITRLGSHWLHYDITWCLVTALTAILLLCCMSFIHPVLGFGILLPLMGFAVYSLWHWSLHRYIRHLSKEDRELILRVSEADPATASKFGSLLSACKVDAQKEYLRPSQPTQDDTLLRAAAPTENAPQDNLLRAIQNDEGKS
jgi:hypothetical protein